MKTSAKHFGLAVALGQATWAKMTPKLLLLWRHSQKIAPTNQKMCFECNPRDWPIPLSTWTVL